MFSDGKYLISSCYIICAYNLYYRCVMNSCRQLFIKLYRVLLSVSYIPSVITTSRTGDNIGNEHFHLVRRPDS